MSTIKPLAMFCAVLLLAGCAGFSRDGGFAAVQHDAESRLNKQLLWARDQEDRSLIELRVAELLANPLSAEAAVQLALLNNRGLQASFDELGIGEADRVQADRLPNPGFSFGRLEKGSEVEYERGLQLNLARWIALPMISRQEGRRFEQLQRQISLAVFELASETLKAWYQAVAAEEGVIYARQVLEAAEAGAELARRMAVVGNFSRLQQAEQQSFYAEVGISLIQAEQIRMRSREQLARLLGLWGGQLDYQLPERLPALPDNAEELLDVERLALSQRQDILSARLDAERLAQNLGAIRTLGFINVLELGVVNNRSNEAPTLRGYEVGVELPLFDWGGANKARAEAQYRQALNRAAEIAVNARSQVREAYKNYRNTFELARHYRAEVLPLSRRIAAEKMLRYNGMFISTFDLIADARRQVQAVSSYLQAQLDFWQARVELDRALSGIPRISHDSALADVAELTTADS
ncbi:TolC family protein [Pseudomonas sp. NCCP-436]|uniref:TolC family protein n=1 Tax=Pseudomonas sp. NCCP-436 TaxID=2842481 RepID=UPI001C826B4D|nr:TolC family protein [Pseudomonas sp. NCCP-436]